MRSAKVLVGVWEDEEDLHFKEESFPAFTQMTSMLQDRKVSKKVVASQRSPQQITICETNLSS